MSKVFRITPKRIKRVNGTVLTPDMVITVTTRQHTTDPFYNGAVEIQEQYMRMYQFDYMQKTVDIHPPKTGISVHFSDSFILVALQI